MGRAARSPKAPTSAYDAAAQASASVVVDRYSTSFGWACRLLREPVRTHVRCIYALVRVADEVVDDVDAPCTPAQRAALLEELERETDRAVREGRSTNLVVHAFAVTARRYGIGPELTGPFFASMRADLTVRSHDQDSLADYVHGSAEVVGLMCLRVFVDGDEERYAALAPGARRLGAAFQKLNFLRDLDVDQQHLGRRYFPGVEGDRLTDADRDRLLDDIDADLAAAAPAVARLPGSSRRAVAAAHALFSALSRRLRATRAADITAGRVRVPTAAKAAILARCVVTAR